MRPNGPARPPECRFQWQHAEPTGPLCRWRKQKAKARNQFETEFQSITEKPKPAKEPDEEEKRLQVAIRGLEKRLHTVR